MQGIGGFPVAVQRKFLLQQAHVEQASVERRHILESVETLADGVQRPDTDGGHQGGQQQHQDKAQCHFLCHAEVGKLSLHA
ncbi:hypothetical protein D3C71_2013350 [compost metagenome]